MRDLINMVTEKLSPGTMTLWHGGRNLESDYLEVRGPGKGRWEHGPGLYLTTHQETASRYAKGGGKLYRVTIGQGTNIDDVTVSRDDAVSFVNSNVTKRLRAQIIADLDANMSRRSSHAIQAEVLVNLCLNWDALPGVKSTALRQFLIDQGVDYATTRFGGRDETVVVVYNPAIIQKIDVVKAGDVDADDRVRPAVFA